VDTSTRRRWLVLVTVGLGLFMALIDATIVNIAIPAIMDDLDASVSSVSWVLNAYNLCLAVLVLAAGTVADRFGQKRTFIVGLVLFTGFSAACGAAPSIAWLVAFRVGQAVGAAALIPISLAVITRAFPKEKYGIAVGVWGAIGAVAAACGPSLGGLLVDYASWQWIFFVNVPIGVVALVMVARYVSEHREPSRTRLDVLGLVTSAAGFFCLTLGLIQANDWGWSSRSISGLFIAAALILAFWLVWELRTRDPLVDVRLFRIGAFAAANASLIAMSFAMMGALFLLILFMVKMLGYSELSAALSVTPMPLMGAVLAPFVGRFVDRFSARWPVLVGMTVMAVGLYLLSQLTLDAGAADITWRTLILGVGMGLSMPSLASAGVACLPQEKTATGSSVLNWSRQMGFVIGVAVLVAVFTQSMTSEIEAAAGEAKTVVASQSALPPEAKTAVGSGIDQMVADASESDETPDTRELQQRLSAAAPHGAGAEAFMTRLVPQLKELFSDARLRAFDQPFTVAALVALCGALPGLALGRRRAAGAETAAATGSGLTRLHATDEP
jgi:EmrB/QacA subfamily drug resistance transporter